MTLRMVLILLCSMAVGCATGPGQGSNHNGNGENGEPEEYVAESYCSPTTSPQAGSQRFAVQVPMPPVGQASEELLFLTPATRPGQSG